VYSLSFSEVEWKKTISVTPSAVSSSTPLRMERPMQVANRTTRVAQELVMNRWWFHIRKRDGLSLESREGRDGDNVAHGKLGHGGMLEGAWIC